MKSSTTIIDTRTGAEYLISHIPGAILLPYETIEFEIENHVRDKSNKIALYCRSGQRSGIANIKLKRMGYTNTDNYGGYLEAFMRLKDENVID
jgi:phage shock protein E